MTATVRGTVAKRSQSTPAEIAVAEMKKKITGHLGWFENVVPSHIDAKWFMSLCLGAINRGSDELVRALVDAPDSFLWAASECARKGLVPGETYYFVPFRNNTDKQRGPYYQVTGITGYTGEIEMIYRSGGVISVHYAAVRARDRFRWQPNLMELPEHHIAGQGVTAELREQLGDELVAAMLEQEGLAGGLEERGPLTGVYAYAKLAGGGYSQPAVLGRAAVMRRRASAKTQQFWGPAWPKEGRDNEKMWLKSAIHELYPGVPHSTEYVTERLRVLAAPVMPALEGKVAPTGEDDEPLVSGEPTDEREAAVQELFAAFSSYRMSDPDARRAVATGALSRDELVDLSELSVAEIHRVTEFIGQFTGEYTGDEQPQALAAYASRVAAEIMRRS
jgi:recombination protein RecT